jgi:catechol 2,3-dioxygenase-like lactoylglutathione lyase family enzyme
MAPTMTHVALHVRDVDRSAQFYRDFCGLIPVHERSDAGGQTVAWLAEPGRETELVFVLLGGGCGGGRRDDDFGHLGFACASAEEVDAIAERARDRGLLLWPPRQEPFPVGYYCGVVDPDGNAVEFSFGQPLGPGAPAPDGERT